MERVKARKDGIVRQSNEGVTKWLKSMENLTVYEGLSFLKTTSAAESLAFWSLAG